MNSITSAARRATFLSSAAVAGIAMALAATPADAIIINNNFTPTDARDPTNITGIGQMIVNSGGGFVGLCTGTLINPRTVIFAAHCVNSRAATAYGAGQGGTPIAFGFETNTRANAPGQPDELINWLNGGSTGPGVNRTNTAQAFYNVNQVIYNIRSTEAASRGFLYADIALAAFDTPAVGIPQWTMLFSPLASPASINPATGTGYHVTIAGYGANGTGTTGAGGQDFRRRIAENMLGSLASLDDIDTFLFGGPNDPPLSQVLYNTDFDDPLRGGPGANSRDFNAWRDNALTREGATGPGDSGGPLIIDQAFARPTIIGVLSGGSTYFTGQPRSSYGTTSFYQPLFLYWDYIVANNPYRYATAAAGNGNWTDTNRWVLELDPAYQILSGNTLVNGVPNDLGAGVGGTQPKFGEVCFQSPSNTPNPATNECQNLGTGQPRNNVPNTPTGTGGNEQLAGDHDGRVTVMIDAEQGAGGTVNSSIAMVRINADGTTTEVVDASETSVSTGAVRFSSAGGTMVSERSATGGTINSSVAMVRINADGTITEVTDASETSVSTGAMRFSSAGGTMVSERSATGGSADLVSGVSSNAGSAMITADGSSSGSNAGTAMVTAGGAEAGSNAGSATIGTGEGGSASNVGNVNIGGSDVQAMASLSPQALPPATIANGLPGATGFVPNNTDGVRATGVAARYYDVTLRNAGTTTLSSAVTIDRFAVRGPASALTITSAGSLTSLIDVTQTAGQTNVDGTLTTPGDYALLGGLLTGTGTVRTPFLTSVLGSFAPGRINSIGTLTVAGNLVMSSGTQTSIDLGANGVSDLLRTQANGTSTGLITVGGILGLNPTARPVFGNTYTVVQSSSTLNGTFSAVTAISSGVLFPVVSYTSNAVNVRIDARPYLQVINPASPVQVALARLLDGNRNRGTLLDVFFETDVLSAANVQLVLELAAPRTEATSRSLARISTDLMGGFYRDRIAYMASDDAGGTLTMIGQPVQLASAALSGTGDMQTMSDANSGGMVQTRGVFPDNVSAYIAGGALDGRADPLPTLLFTQRDFIDAWYAAAGIEIDITEDTRIGLGVHYVDGQGRSTVLQSSDTTLAQGTMYSHSELGNGLIATTQLSIGEFGTRTTRQIPAGGTTFTIRGRNDALTASGEIGLGYRLEFGGGLTLTPNAAGRYTLVDFGDGRETGGGFALITQEKEYESLQGRVGADLGGDIESGSLTISPRLTGAFVHEFMDQARFVVGSFAESGFNGGAVPFLLPGADRNWAEVGGGLRVSGERVSLDLQVGGTLGRGDLNYRTVRGSATLRF